MGWRGCSFSTARPRVRRTAPVGPRFTTPRTTAGPWVGDVSGQLEVLELLAAAGADVNAGDSRGVHVRAQRGAVGQDGDSAFAQTARRVAGRRDGARGYARARRRGGWTSGGGGRTRAMVAGRARRRGLSGHQPIHHAAYHGHVDVVEVLLRHGAEVQPGRRRSAPAEDGDVNRDQNHGSPSGGANKERHGTTPLHLAVRSGSVGVVAALLAGADPRRRDSHGWTPRGLLQECAARKAPG